METIKEIPEEQRPYEKCFQKGAASLTDSELLAVILRSGTQGKSSVSLANTILNRMAETAYPGLLGILHIPLADLMEIHGIGRVKAIQLKCIGELSKRIAASAARTHLSFHDPRSIAEFYMEQLRHEEQEIMISIMLDSKNHMIADQQLTRGTVNFMLVSPREVYLEALKNHAVSIILLHNHPSGDPTPSQEDYETTEKIYHAGKLLGISLLDHIIIGDHKYFSFLEEGIITDFN